MIRVQRERGLSPGLSPASTAGESPHCHITATPAPATMTSTMLEAARPVVRLGSHEIVPKTKHSGRMLKNETERLFIWHGAHAKRDETPTKQTKPGKPYKTLITTLKGLASLSREELVCSLLQYQWLADAER